MILLFLLDLLLLLGFEAEGSWDDLPCLEERECLIEMKNLGVPFRLVRDQRQYI